jgi:hypothetical protein
MRPSQLVGDPSTCEKISFFRRKHVAYTPLGPAYLEVISKVVPKICARTNSAMLSDCCPDCEGVQFLDRGERMQGEEEVCFVKGSSVGRSR